jgi:hypothetical protein
MPQQDSTRSATEETHELFFVATTEEKLFDAFNPDRHWVMQTLCDKALLAMRDASPYQGFDGSVRVHQAENLPDAFTINLSPAHREVLDRNGYAKVHHRANGETSMLLAPLGLGGSEPLVLITRVSTPWVRLLYRYSESDGGPVEFLASKNIEQDKDALEKATQSLPIIEAFYRTHKIEDAKLELIVRTLAHPLGIRLIPGFESDMAFPYFYQGAKKYADILPAMGGYKIHLRTPAPLDWSCAWSNRPIDPVQMQAASMALDTILRNYLISVGEMPLF